MKDETAILILAAGASTRLGEPKQLLPYKNTTLLKHTIKQVLAIENAKVYVVLGAFFEEIHTSIKQLPITILKNNHWQKGLGSSLHMGVLEIQKNPVFNKVLITLGDLPLMLSKNYQALLFHHKESTTGITATQYPTTTNGVPVIFDNTYFNALSELSGDEGAKSLLKKNKSDVSFCEVSIAFFDIDTKESYLKLINLDKLS
jgi:molybdenum cofactor cytidylyltransferase